jgi:heptosyltransferase-2
MHLASGVGVPLVAIFGPTVREFGFFPFRAPHIVLENFLYCRPCTAFGGSVCPEKHFRCMLNTTVDSVHGAARQMVTLDSASVK